MRTIRFRGKRVDNNDWVYGYYINIQDKHYILEYYSLSDERKELQELLDQLHEINPHTLGQFTGRVCNGRRVYEGDILQGKEVRKGASSLSFTLWRGVVQWDKHGCGFYIEDNSGNKYDLDDYKFDEVVGNVHDSPRLLEGGDIERFKI